MSNHESPLSLSQFTRRIVTAISADPALQQQWVVAETLDVRQSGGHCYLELIEKDDYGRTLARARATIWASVHYRLADKFLRATGQPLASGIKIMALVTASYHQSYGLSLNITDIDPSYTMGSMMRRRMEILQRLKDEGILELNRELPWPAVPLRVAVISAPGAAGYGDFIKTIYTNPYRLRFTTRLFPAVMQGERTSPTVIAALNEIFGQADDWDCVVIIRGGGSSADLISFDDYDLAANIAQFPIPVISGIGHQRDTTVPDYVANMRVITPTDAAKWLIERGLQALTTVQTLAAGVAQEATARLSGCRQQLAEFTAKITMAPVASLARAKAKTDSAAIALSSVSSRRIIPELAGLKAKGQQLGVAVANLIASQRRQLEAEARLLDALSPIAVLRRGYTMTVTSGGHVATSVANLAAGTEITTFFADGSATSTVSAINPSSPQ